MAEAVGSSSSSCPPFSGDERSLFATLSGVVAVFVVFLAQAADLMNGPLFEALMEDLGGESSGYFGKIITAMLVPAFGAGTALYNNYNTRKTSWKLKRGAFWKDGKPLCWDPRTLKVLMVAQIWMVYSGEDTTPKNAGNDASTKEVVDHEEDSSNLDEPHIKVTFDKPDIISSPPPEEDKPPKPKSLKDVEATQPLKIQGKDMLCYKHSALSIEGGVGSHAPPLGDGIVKEQEQHSNRNNHDYSTELTPVSDEDARLEQRVKSLDPTDKQALLQLGFVPDYEELSYLRTDSSWQMMLIGLEILGYIVSGIIRIIEKRIMSPSEVIAMFLSCLSIVQVLFQIFGGISTQRTILIHLTPLEYSSFRKQVEHIQKTDKVEELPVSLTFLFVFGVLIIFAGTIVLPASMVLDYASYFNKAAHHSRVCFASTICFILLLCTQPFVNVSFPNMPGRLPLLGLSLTTVALALVGTIKEWKNLCFNEPSSEWYSVLIPHVGNF